MIARRRWFVIGILLWIAGANSAECRDWHRNDGKLVAQGKLLRVEDGRAIVLTDDGLTIGIPLEQLSLEDSGYLKETVQDRAQPAPRKAAEKMPRAEKEPKPPADAPTKGADGFPLTNPNTTSWQGRVDPPKWNWADLPESVPVSQLPKFNASEGFVMPRTPSPYLAIATARDDARIWDRWDLRTGQRSGAVRGAPRDVGRPAISADGKYLALLPSAGDDNVQVWSFDTGNRVGRVELSERGYSHSSLLFVADGGLLVTLGRAMPSIVDWSTGKERATFTKGYIASDTRTSLSPGEHYFAVYQRQSNRIGILDTRNGVVVGDLLVPAATDDSYNECAAFGFSSDGSRLWALVGNFRNYRLLGWNMADGSNAVTLKLDTLASVSAQDTGRTEFIPDFMEVPRAHAILLKGSLLLDDTTGAVVWDHDVAQRGDEPSILRIVGDSRMLVLRRRSDGMESIAMEPIPFEAIEASRKMIASGGTAQDIGLPPLTQPDWKNVKRVSKIEKADVEYKARPVSAPTDPLERVSLAPDTPRDTGIMSPQLTVAGGSAPWCAALYAIPSKQSDGRRRTPPMLLDSYDLTDGNLKSRMTLTKAASLLDISLDGSRAVVGSTSNGRIDVWNLAGTKHQLGIRPIGVRDKRSSSFQISSAGFPYAKLIGDGQLLTAHDSGELALWQIDGGVPVYSLATLRGSAVAVDPNRTYVLAQDSSGIHICSIDRGKSVKTLSANKLPTDSLLTAAAFRSNGEEVAILTNARAPMVPRLVVWNIVEDTITWDTPLPFMPRHIAWAGDDVLLGSLTPLRPMGMPHYSPSRQRTPNDPNYERKLPEITDEWRPTLMGSVIRVSPTQQRFVWLYQSKPVGDEVLNTRRYMYEGQILQLVGQTAGDTAWLAFGPSVNKITLVTLAKRTTHEEEVIRKDFREKRVEVGGDKVAVSVDVDSLPDTVQRPEQRREEFRKSIETSLKELLAEHTFTVGKDVPLVMQAKLQQRRASDLLAPRGKVPLFSPGMSPNFSPQGPNATGVLARVELRFKDQSDDDDPVWLNEAWFAYENTYHPASNDVRSNIQMLIPWERALGWFDKRTLPTKVVEGNAFASPGSTELSPIETKDGEKPTPQDDASASEGDSEQ